MSAIVACSGEAADDLEVARADKASALEVHVDSKIAGQLDALVGDHKASRVGYHDLWRVLWEDHITWTRMAIIAELDCLPGKDAYTARLLQNYEDMEDALAPYYSAKNVEAFGDLVKDHLVIAASILVAAREGDTDQMNSLIGTWRDNGHALAVQMNKMNPRFWPLQSTDAMWQEHLNLTLAEATSHLQGDFASEIAVWEKVHEGGLMMADLFSGGTMDGVPRAFDVCSVP